MKTILHLIDTTGPGGAETVFIQLADKLRTQNYRSIVVIRGPGWVQEELERRGLSPIILPSKGSFAFGFLWKLVRLLKKEKVDLIQSHLLGSNVYAAMAGLLSGVPVVATYHGMVDVNPNERFRFIKHQAMKWGIKRYVAVSASLMENIEKQRLLDVRKTRVIYNGVDTALYGQAKQHDLKARLGLPEEAIVFGSLGNIRPAKAYDNLIKAGSRVIERYPNAHFVIAGHQKPSLMEKLNTLTQSLGVEKHFHFLGFCSDCADFLAQVDIFVLSSSSEGFSIATIEALASQLPVVATRCGGPEEILTDGENGLLVEANSPEALAKGLLALLASPDLAQRLAEAGSRHAAETFGIEAMLRDYDQIYKALSP